MPVAEPLMVPFVKMQGIGNDFVMIDAIDHPLSDDGLVALARRVNDRKFGIGGDGLILLEKGDGAPFRMRMFNPDGSESEMCGNGIRCFAKLARLNGHTQASEIKVETGAGTLTLQVKDDGQVRVDMGLAKFGRKDIGLTGNPDERYLEETLPGGYKGTAVSMGNPHLVIFVEDVDAINLNDLGPKFEHLPEFKNRTNVHFIQVLDRQTLRQRTWERGAGVTLACGTGACAAAAAAWITKRADANVKIHLPGGDLQIEIQEDHRVFMTGPAEIVFTGELAV